jgi:hypothetical protein
LFMAVHAPAVRFARIAGLDGVLAAVIIAELGTDMSVFKSAAHLASRADVCPGNGGTSCTDSWPPPRGARPRPWRDRGRTPRAQRAYCVSTSRETQL